MARGIEQLVADDSTTEQQEPNRLQASKSESRSDGPTDASSDDDDIDSDDFVVEDSAPTTRRQRPRRSRRLSKIRARSMMRPVMTMKPIQHRGESDGDFETTI